MNQEKINETIIKAQKVNQKIINHIQDHLPDHLPDHLQDQLQKIQQIEQLQKIRYQPRPELKYLKHLDLDSLKQRFLKKLTILHSNDLHGDFLAENIDSGLVGGVSMLSGYINKVKEEEENVIYAIAGDMLRGSIIDSEFKGLSTIEIMNLLTPDVATIGNHEVDYGLEHLLFIEKCANFPIINANMYLTCNGTRLFNSHITIKIAGLKILFIGILTEDVLNATKQEELIGKLIDIKDAAEEVRRVTDAYRTIDTDLTVLLTHVGFERDKELAAELARDGTVDIIIGGHSHTYLEEPCVVEGIPIVQAAVGTAQIGRFDILFDELHNRIDSYTWKLIPITDETCPRDEALENLVGTFKEKTDAKYGRILTRFPCAYTHLYFNRETELGDLLAEGMREQLGVDLAMINSGSIRRETLGPIVTLQDLMEVYPYPTSMVGIRLSGEQLRRIVMFLLRDEVIADGAYTYSFQFSKGFFCEYDISTRRILQLTMNGAEVQDEDMFLVALEGYHYNLMETSLGIPVEEVEKNGRPVQLAIEASNVLTEYLTSHEFIKLDGEQRFLLHS